MAAATPASALPGNERARFPLRIPQPPRPVTLLALHRGHLCLLQLIAGVHARESVAEALERLSRLRENGLLTDFEYAAAKGAVFRSAA